MLPESTLKTCVPIPGHVPVPSDSSSVSLCILIRVARVRVVTSAVLNTSTPYCLPFSVLSSSTKAKCVSGLAGVVPAVPTSVLEFDVSLLLTIVVSLIVRNC